MEKVKKLKERRKLIQGIKELSEMKDIKWIEIFSRSGKEELKRLIREKGFNLMRIEDDKLTWVKKEKKIPIGIIGSDEIRIELTCYLKDYKDMNMKEIKKIRKELEKVNENEDV